MKRSHGNESDKRMLEEKNETLTSDLKHKVNNLKSLSIEIGTEIRNQNEFLNQMDDSMSKSGNFLAQVMRRVGIVSKGTHNYFILILFSFCFFAFIILWLILKFR